jgi:hypothetical protein
VGELLNHHTSSARALAIFVGFAGPLLVAAGGAGRALAEAHPVPSAIVGSWRTHCAADLPHRLRVDRIRTEAWSRLGRTTCRLAGYRLLIPKRWYLDFDCADGSLLQLDINLVHRDRLLIARRPLGEACVYQRSRDR